ncbi:MAG: glycosyltransferase [Acidimicrobiales bacterium]|jgi:hypothetical protein
MVTQLYPPVAGGQEQHVRNLAHALAERGHDVEAVTCRSSSAFLQSVHEPVRLHPLHSGHRALLKQFTIIYPGADFPPGRSGT